MSGREDGDLAVDFLGHATLLIEIDGVRILTDPLVRDHVGPLDRQVEPLPHTAFERIDAVLISHLHQDHLDFASLRRLQPAPRLIVPAGAGGLVWAAGYADVDELDAGGSTRHGAVHIAATPAIHSGRRLPFGPTAVALGFVIEGTRQRVYFAGDTDLFDGMAAIGERGLDVALLPVWGWGPNLRGGHLDPTKAARSLELLHPRTAVPIHWGTYWPRGMGMVRPDRLRLPATEFEAAARELAPDVRVVVTAPGRHVQLPR
ncbi:MAG TPA: MBL fold metallo-hydrolase [Candidatus Binatia bacterium]|nr:MBL fold metallo-hydrolase [Candidatus Binatia bacterium]